MEQREIRFAWDIAQLELLPVETGKVLLYGSSFFAVWGVERAKKQWSDATSGALQVVNHGFGGARVDEMIHYYHRMVTPYAPSAIVFRTGVNDIFHGMSAEETMAQTQTLFSMARQDFPHIKFLVILVFDTLSANQAQMNELRKYNRLLEDYAKAHENIAVIDLNPFFYKEETDIGTCQNFQDVFQSDMLHLTDEGYVRMADYLAPMVQKLLLG